MVRRAVADAGISEILNGDKDADGMRLVGGLTEEVEVANVVGVDMKEVEEVGKVEELKLVGVADVVVSNPIFSETHKGDLGKEDGIVNAEVIEVLE